MRPALPVPQNFSHIPLRARLHRCTKVDFERATLDESVIDARREALPYARSRHLEYAVHGKFKARADGASYPDTVTAPALPSALNPPPPVYPLPILHPIFARSLAPPSPLPYPPPPSLFTHAPSHPPQVWLSITELREAGAKREKVQEAVDRLQEEMAAAGEALMGDWGEEEGEGEGEGEGEEDDVEPSDGDDD